MRSLPSILFLGLLAVAAKPAEPDDQLPPAPDGKTWKLVWHDEFDGDNLDEAKWPKCSTSCVSGKLAWALPRPKPPRTIRVDWWPRRSPTWSTTSRA